MLDSLLQGAGQYITTSPWLALAAVFAGGVVTASNPCVLAMIPLMMGFVAGRDRKTGVATAFLHSLVFVSGLGITFVAMGITAALAGSMYGDISSVWNFVVAAVCILMGIHMTGLLTIPIPSIAGRALPNVTGMPGAFLLGLLFGVVSAPCAAPMLIVLLTYIAGSGSSIAWGGALLLVYALGHSVLILLAGTSMGLARKLVESGRAARITRILRIVAGVAVIFVGIYFAAKGINK